jgi:hypothetical protein
MTACATIFNRYYRAPKRVVAESGPTVLLDANYLTDTLLRLDDSPATSSGHIVARWITGTGGEFNRTLAQAAGATDDTQLTVGSGVSTGGVAAALTCATPVTIPANTDCVIYAKVNLGAYESQLYAVGASGSGNRYVSINTGDTETEHSTTLNFDGSANVYAVLTGEITTGVYLLRYTRASGVWSFACTGVASAAMTPTGTVSGAISFDTLLAFSSAGGTLDAFSGSTMFVQKLKIWTGTSSPDTTFETANGGTL